VGKKPIFNYGIGRIIPLLFCMILIKEQKNSFWIIKRPFGIDFQAFLYYNTMLIFMEK
jgi:hypothetical protein